MKKATDQQQAGTRLAVRVFFAMAALLTITVTITFATMMYNSAGALQEEAESSAVQLVELLANGFADIGEISLANVARTLDSTLDDQMIAQARIAAHLVAVAEQGGYPPADIIAILEQLVADTVLDEFWITDETAFSYLTNVRDPQGQLVPFAFEADPTVQPQASKFYVLLNPATANDFITQPAQVREIDQEVYKYVGVPGVDKPRIVQVGNAIVFGEQEILTNTFTSERADVSAVIEGILVQQLEAHAQMLAHLVAVAEASGWAVAAVNDVLRQITDSSIIGEIAVTDSADQLMYASSDATPADGYPAFAEFGGGVAEAVVRADTVTRQDGTLAEQVSLLRPDSGYLVHVGIPIEGTSGNLLYSVYQSEADRLVQSENLVSLWVVNQNNEVAAAAPRAAALDTSPGMSAFATFADQAQGLIAQALDTGAITTVTQLSLLDPEQRGLWTAAPIVNAGGIQIGGIGIETSLDGIAQTLRQEFVTTLLIALVLLLLTAVAAFAGSRWLTHPIELIADVARQVESGVQPRNDPMREVMQRTDEIGSLARVFSDMTVQVFNREEQLETLVAERTHELRTSNRHLTLAKESMDRDLEMAKVVQTALVQEGQVRSGTVEGYARMTPAQQVGGDFVTIRELIGGGRLFFVVGDVSGKGVAASLFMVAAQAAISNAAGAYPTIAEIAFQANREICNTNPMGLFVTCALGLVDTETGVIDYVNAGHDPALHLDRGGSFDKLPLTGGLAMGVDEEFGYESGQTELAPEESIFLYTDGLTDAINLQASMFGHQRLVEVLQRTVGLPPQQVVEQTWQTILEFSAGAPVADDMTCLLLKRHG